MSLPLGLQSIIGFAMAGSVSTSIVVLIVLVVIGTFVNGLLLVRQMQVIERVEQKLFVRYSVAFTERLPKLDVEKMDRYYLPEVVNRFFETVSLQKGLEKLLLDIPTAAVQVVLGIILLALYHPLFIGFGVVVLLIVYLIVRFSSPKGFESALKASDYKYAIAAWVEEIARTLKPFKYATATHFHLRKSDRVLNGYIGARTTYFKVLLGQSWSMVGFKVVITGGMLILGVTLLVNQQINIGQFIATDIVILTLIGSVDKLVGNLEKVFDALVSVEKLAKITEAPLEKSGTLVMDDKGLGLSIEFDKVEYAYENGKPILSGASFAIEKGESVLIYGSSGSGKSSLLRLLSSALTSFKGNILINSVPIGNYSVQSLRDRTGVLLQQQEVFQGTLWENLTMGNNHVTIDEALEIAALTEIDAYVKSLPNGFDTELLPDGMQLPTKTKKNIALTRALLGRPRLLLLECPFDYLSEAKANGLCEYLNGLKGTTVIVIGMDDPMPKFKFDKRFKMEQGKLELINPLR